MLRKEKLAHGVGKFQIPTHWPTICGDRCPSWYRASLMPSFTQMSLLTL